MAPKNSPPPPLRAQIMNHSLPPGTSLPSEAQLQVRYGVSRSAVRQALGALAAEGLIERGRGRGSTVAPRREHHRLVHQTSGLSAQIAGTGTSVGTEVLSLALQDADASTEILGTPQVLALARLRTADGVPIAVIHTWLPAPLAGLTAEDLHNASLHAVLGKKYGVQIISGKRQIRAVPGNQDLLRLLQLDDGAPVLLLEGTSYNQDGRTAEDLHNASLHAVLGKKYGVQIISGKRQIRAVPGDQDLLRLLQLDDGAPVLLLEGTSYDQDGRPVEVFSTWHHPDHVVFDIYVQEDSPAPSALVAPGGPTPSPDDAPDPLADRARRLGAELLRFADDISGNGH
ncbi:GntR family transcriptional regulator [Arthrobacter sp. MDT1-65]